MDERTQTEFQPQQHNGSQPVIQDIFAAADEYTPSTPVQPATTENMKQAPHELQYQPLQFGSISDQPTAQPILRRSRPRWLLPALIGGVVVVLGATAAVVLIVRNGKTGQQQKQVTVLNVNVSQPINTVHIPSANTNMQAPAVDTDGDGLTDAEESELKTDIRLIDSDQDGLTDREEVKVYNTDPLNPDTDGDGYKDGEEVRKLFNPKGPGRLFDVKQEINKAQSQTNQ